MKALPTAQFVPAFPNLSNLDLWSRNAIIYSGIEYWPTVWGRSYSGIGSDVDGRWVLYDPAGEIFLHNGSVR